MDEVQDPQVAGARTELGSVWRERVDDLADRQRGMIETGFRTLKMGTRLRRRQLDPADDRRQCPAFDAITAARVADRTALAREQVDLPATAVFDPAEIDLRHTGLRAQGHKIVPMPRPRPTRPPPREGIPRPRRTGPPPHPQRVIGLGRRVGRHPSKRPPLPGRRRCGRGSND